MAAELFAMGDSVMLIPPSARPGQTTKSIEVGKFSCHWQAVAAMLRFNDAKFRSLSGDAEPDLFEEARMRAQVALVLSDPPA